MSVSFSLGKKPSLNAQVFQIVAFKINIIIAFNFNN